MWQSLVRLLTLFLLHLLSASVFIYFFFFLKFVNVHLSSDWEAFLLRFFRHKLQEMLDNITMEKDLGTIPFSFFLFLSFFQFPLAPHNTVTRGSG